MGAGTDTDPEPSEASAARRVGRPRASGLEPTGDVREQILQASADLFSEKGYSGTSTRAIAEAVGLRQGSLMHYFARKQDILAALVNRAIRPAVEHFELLKATGLPWVVVLYRFVHSDCLSICADDLNAASLVVQPETRTLDLPEVKAEREALVDVYRALIDHARDEGDLAVTDLDLAVDAVIGIVESIAVWYRPDGAVTPDACADQVTAMIIAGLLARPADLEMVIEAAAHAPAAPQINS